MHWAIRLLSILSNHCDICNLHDLADFFESCRCINLVTSLVDLNISRLCKPFASTCIYHSVLHQSFCSPSSNMSSIFDNTSNYSIYAVSSICQDPLISTFKNHRINTNFHTQIPAAWILSIAPHIYASRLAGKKFDNRAPRGFVETIKHDQSIDKHVRISNFPSFFFKPLFQSPSLTALSS